MEKKQKESLLKTIKNYLNRKTDKRNDAEGEDVYSNMPRRPQKPSATPHGNTRIPYGLCKEFGIQVGSDWTPRDAWNALKDGGITHPDEIWETLQENKKLAPWKGEYRVSAPRSLEVEDLGALMPKGKTKKTAPERAMEEFIEQANKRYSVRGDVGATALFSTIGKLQKDTGMKGYLEFGKTPMYGFDSYYYSPKKGKIKIPPHHEGRDNHYFLAGTTYAMSSYLDYLCGEDGKPMSAMDKGVNKVMARYKGKNLKIEDVPWAAEADRTLREHMQKKLINAKKTKEDKLLDDELKEDYEKMMNGEMAESTYYSKRFKIISTDDRFKNIREVESRIERETTYREIMEDFLGALSMDDPPGRSPEQLKALNEKRTNRMVSAYIALAEIEPRALGYIRQDMPDVSNVMDRFIDKMGEKAGADYTKPDYTLKKFEPLPEEEVA